ncbi:unnamed protein product [Heligmosomoides polygyrus]|uniref:Uncharacterized protein n=1 Tax=Heligmosomoides polygyrus TaxID=6339 RepID=A0A183FA22_HELPZ|nr:unnamed protein product [Heligmosomoides polygyrus]
MLRCEVCPDGKGGDCTASGVLLSKIVCITFRPDDHRVAQDAGSAPIVSPSHPRVLQWITLARGIRGASYRSFSAFTKKSDQCIGGRPGVLLTSRRIQWVTDYVGKTGRPL